MGGDLYGDPVVGRPAYPADILVRPDPVVAVPALKHLVVGFVLVPLIFAEASAGQSLGANGSGEGFRFKRFLRLVVSGHFDRLFRSANQHLQEKVRHHQLLADVVEPLRLLIVLKAPGWLDRLVGSDAVAVEVVESGYHGGFEIGMIDVEQVTQRVAQLEFIQPPNHRLSTGALAGRIGLLQNRTSGP